MRRNDMVMSLDGNTFYDFKADFNAVLRRVLDTMRDKGAKDATISVKMAIQLDDASVDSYNGGEKVVMPTIKHAITSAVKIEDKASGRLGDDMILVYDDESDSWVLRMIEDGQLSFDENGEIRDYTDEEPLDDEEVTNASERARYMWIKRLEGEPLHVVDDGNKITVIKTDGSIALSSAVSENSITYVDGEIIKEHVGEDLVCEERYGGYEIRSLDTDELICRVEG